MFQLRLLHQDISCLLHSSLRILRALRKFQGVLLRDLHRILYRDRPSHVQGLAEGHSGEIFLNHFTEEENKPFFQGRSRRLRVLNGLR
jgi:hypothetical protein